MTRAFFEFFAGGGMARAGLGPEWRCLLANDIDPAKGRAYAENFGREHLRICDVAELTTRDLPGQADLAWMSPPCQDISEAGGRSGLDGARSGAFWPCWRLVQSLVAEGRAPRAIVLENVPGLLASHGGADIAAIRRAFEAAGYRHATATIDARHFVPQSRPRIFVIGLRGADAQAAADRMLADLPRRNVDLIDILDLDAPSWPLPEVERHLAMIAPPQRKRLSEAPRPFVGAFARRMRGERSGERVQRVELRFDGLANALRVASTGGSSRQFVVIADGAGEVRMRPILAREAARLMGLPENYALPANEVEALSLCGDGVVVQVVRHIAAHVLEPLLAQWRAPLREAAEALEET